MRIFLLASSSFLWLGLSACGSSPETSAPSDETLVATSDKESVGDTVGKSWQTACQNAPSRYKCCQKKEDDSDLPEAEKTKAYNKCIEKKASEGGLDTHVAVPVPEQGKTDSGN